MYRKNQIQGSVLSIILGIRWGGEGLELFPMDKGELLQLNQRAMKKSLTLFPISLCVFVVVVAFLLDVSSGKLKGQASFFLRCSEIVKWLQVCFREHLTVLISTSLGSQVSYSVGSIKVLTLHGRSGLEIFIGMNQLFYLLLGPSCTKLGE